MTTTINVNIDHFSGWEAIELERCAEKTIGAVARELMGGDVTSQTALALAYVVARREHPALKWKDFLGESAAESISLILETTEEEAEVEEEEGPSSGG